MNTFQYFDASMVQPLMDAIGKIEGRKITQEEFARKVPTGTRSVSGWVSTKENSPKKMTMASRQGCVDIAADYDIDLDELRKQLEGGG